jgi:hypothetical protein
LKLAGVWTFRAQHVRPSQAGRSHYFVSLVRCCRAFSNVIAREQATNFGQAAEVDFD